MKAGRAFALLENALVRGLEQTIGHLIAIEIGGQIFERHLPLHVAAAVLGAEPLDGLGCCGHERWSNRYLEHAPRADVQLLDAHNGLVQVVVDGDFEALAGLQVKRVVERLGVEEHAEAVGLADLGALDDGPVVLAEDLLPVGHTVQIGVEGNLWFDDATDAVVRAEVGVEVRVVTKARLHTVAGLEIEKVQCN